MPKTSEKITYIFNQGRSERIKSGTSFPKEHFYGYFESVKNRDTFLIEYTNEENVKSFLYKAIRKIIKFPIYSEKLLTMENKNILDNSDNMIFTNQNTFYSAFPYFINNKIDYKKITVFFMGYKNILNKKTKFSIFQKIFFNSVLKKLNKAIFLSEFEKNYFLNEFPKFSEKAHYIPFSIDKDFWIKEKKLKRDAILVLGNDESRDYQLITNIINKMPNENFIIVSNKINKDILKYENFTLYDSDWKTNKLTDEELKSIFNECKLSIIPIKTSSLQPSGQSVALQSFAMEVPVMMSNFKGVWDKDLLLHMENIFFVEEASVECWINNINLLLDQKELQEKLIHNARKLIDENLNLSNFYKRLDKVINS